MKKFQIKLIVSVSVRLVGDIQNADFARADIHRVTNKRIGFVPVFVRRGRDAERLKINRQQRFSLLQNRTRNPLAERSVFRFYKIGANADRRFRRQRIFFFVEN